MSFSSDHKANQVKQSHSLNKSPSPTTIFLALDCLRLSLDATNDDVQKTYERLSAESANLEYINAYNILMSVKLPLVIGEAMDDEGNPVPPSSKPQTAVISPPYSPPRSVADIPVNALTIFLTFVVLFAAIAGLAYKFNLVHVPSLSGVVTFSRGIYNWAAPFWTGFFLSFGLLASAYRFFMPRTSRAPSVWWFLAAYGTATLAVPLYWDYPYQLGRGNIIFLVILILLSSMVMLKLIFASLPRRMVHFLGIPALLIGSWTAFMVLQTELPRRPQSLTSAVPCEP